jgi:hypothetical protein
LTFRIVRENCIEMIDRPLVRRWRRIAIVAIVVAGWPGWLSDLASAEENCQAMPAGSARTDCYIGLGRIYRGQSDVAAGKARVQSDAARYQQVTGTRSPSKASKHRRKGPATVDAQ